MKGRNGKMSMWKKSIKFIICAAFCFSMAACGSQEEENSLSGDKGTDVEVNSSINSGSINSISIPLDEDEKEVLELVSEDINVVADDNYIATLGELMYHTEEFSGQLYQMEGVFVFEGEVPYVARSLVNGDVKTSLGLPLAYLVKEIEEGAWVRVTGIVNEGDINGGMETVLEVVAIEALPEAGQAELPWDGESLHQH